MRRCLQRHTNCMSHSGFHSHVTFFLWYYHSAIPDRYWFCLSFVDFNLLTKNWFKVMFVLLCRYNYFIITVPVIFLTRDSSSQSPRHSRLNQSLIFDRVISEIKPVSRHRPERVRLQLKWAPSGLKFLCLTICSPFSIHILSFKTPNPPTAAVLCVNLLWWGWVGVFWSVRYP